MGQLFDKKNNGHFFEIHFLAAVFHFLSKVLWGFFSKHDSFCFECFDSIYSKSMFQTLGVMLIAVFTYSVILLLFHKIFTPNLQNIPTKILFLRILMTVKFSLDVKIFSSFLYFIQLSNFRLFWTRQIVFFWVWIISSM